MRLAEKLTYVLGVAALVFGAAAYPVAADTYTQYTQATVGDIQSRTVATWPANRARVIIGIAEQVDCWIDPNTWADQDCNVTQHRVEDDTIGTCTWSVSGAGTLSTTTGFSTQLTAHRSPGTAVVTAVVLDSRTKFNDTVTKQKTFTVIAPNGMNSAKNRDVALGTQGPPNNQIGARTIFDCQVLPTTVNFNRAKLREHIPGENWVWPDSTPGSRPAAIVPWSTTGQNMTTDNVSSGLDPIGRIHNGVNYVDFTYNVRVPEEYLNQSNLWVSWLPGENHPRNYRGADQKARVRLIATNTADGGWQGPWR